MADEDLRILPHSRAGDCQHPKCPVNWEKHASHALPGFSQDWEAGQTPSPGEQTDTQKCLPPLSIVTVYQWGGREREGGGREGKTESS